MSQTLENFWTDRRTEGQMERCAGGPKKGKVFENLGKNVQNLKIF